MYFVLTCKDQATCAAAKCVRHPNGSAITVAVALEVKGGNIVVARNDIFSLIWRCYGPKWDIFDC